MSEVIEILESEQAESLARIRDGLLMITPVRRAARYFQNVRLMLLRDRLRTAHGDEMVERVADAKFLLDLRQMHDVRMHADIARYGAYEPETTHLITRMLQPGDTFVDVGANNGYFAILAGQRVGPEGTVVAVEPNPAAVARLQRNVQLNHLEGTVRILPVALGDTNGEATLYVSTFEDGWASLEAFRGSGPPIPVRVSTLDGALDPQESLFLKVDTEGTEPRVLRGMENLLGCTRNVAMILEWNHLFGTRSMWEYIRSRFRVHLILPGPSGSGARLREVHSWDQLRPVFLRNLLLTSGPRWSVPGTTRSCTPTLPSGE